MVDARGNRLKRLVDDVVLAQGNDFIKELLRSKGLRIGATKPQFRMYLHDAVDDGQLTEADVEAWLHAVEGWGAQHVYLYTVPEAFATDRRWLDPAALRRLSGHADCWDASSSYAYPDDLTLTGVYFDGDRLRYVWHRGITSRQHVAERDFVQEIGGDTFEFDAYLRRRERTVMRFELRRADRLAVVFVQEPITGDAHDVALADMWDTVAPLVPRSEVKPFGVGRLITRLAEHGSQLGIRRLKTRFRGRSASVEFASLSTTLDYDDDEDIRESHLALRTRGVSGDRADFVVPSGDGEVRMSMYGMENRMYLRAQVTEEQMWTLLRLFRAQV